MVVGPQSRAAEARMLRSVLMIAALLHRNAAGAEVALKLLEHQKPRTVLPSLLRQ